MPTLLQAPNAVDAVKRTMRDHPEIDTLDDAQRGQILDLTARVLNNLGDRPWGRKSRNREGTDLNTDGLTYLRVDGLFEIYDVISGADGSATWEGFGPFRPGENGYWMAVRPAEEEIPPTDDPPDDEPTRDELAAALLVLAGRVETLETELKALKDVPAVILPSLRVKGRTHPAGGIFGRGAHSHEIDLLVVPE